MSIEAEALLAATGLLHPPDRTARTAAKHLVADLRKQLIGVLDHENQRRLRVNDQTESYLKKLAATPDYEGINAIIESKYGLTMVGQYMEKHMAARQLLLDSYPAQEVETSRGVVPQPPDPELLAQWLLDVDTIENQRIVSDLAAGAVLPETVTVFKTVFPEIYAYLVTELNEAIATKPADWIPPIWLEMAIGTFAGAPMEGAPPAKPSEEPKPQGKAKLNIKDVQTSAQKALKAG